MTIIINGAFWCWRTWATWTNHSSSTTSLCITTLTLGISTIIYSRLSTSTTCYRTSRPCSPNTTYNTRSWCCCSIYPSTFRRSSTTFTLGSKFLTTISCSSWLLRYSRTSLKLISRISLSLWFTIPLICNSSTRITSRSITTIVLTICRTIVYKFSITISRSSNISWTYISSTTISVCCTLIATSS